VLRCIRTDGLGHWPAGQALLDELLIGGEGEGSGPPGR
jgi:hypothetical protein